MMSGDRPDFQQALARHLRDPRHTPRPAGLPARTTALYGELVFNNLCGFVDSCFPLCRQLLGERLWRRLCRTFLRDWPVQTPWFRDIPREFARYLTEAPIRQRRPAWLAELAHYEWAELAVDIMETANPAHDPAGDLYTRRIVLNPARLDLVYAWPVHRIGPDWRPRQGRTSYLVIYRDALDEVRFSEINALTARLLELLAGEPRTGEQALQQLADEIRHPAPHSLLAFGHDLLCDLRAQGIILGSQS